jgi:hypothetical protein
MIHGYITRAPPASSHTGGGNVNVGFTVVN